MSLSASYSSINPKKPKKNLIQRIRAFISSITVEPFFVCYMLSFSMSALTHQNLNLEKACRVNLNMSDSVCHALRIRNVSGFNKSDEVTVQQLVAEAYVWKNVIFSVFPAMLLVSLGSWSDRNQCRKVLMLLPLVGQAFSNIGLLVSTYFFNEISMEFNVLIDVLPAALTGANCMLLVGVFSYISETTADDKKTWRIGIVHIMMAISSTTGYALSGVLYRWIGFYGVFSIATALYLFGTIYGFYFVKENNLNVKKQENIVKDVFNIKKALKTYKFMGKKENCEKIKQLCLITFVAVLNIGPIAGGNAVLYLYTRYKFHWDEVDFSIFFTYYSVSHLIGSTFALWFFSKYLKIDDTLLGAFSVVSKILGEIIYTLAPTALIFYTGVLAEMFSGIAFIASRSIISKIIPPEELGRANSVFGIAESLTVLIYGPMYSALYKATLGIFSGSFFVLGAILLIPAIIIYIWMYFYQKRQQLNEKVDVNESNKETLLSPIYQLEQVLSTKN